jgi:hypothetical protein
MRVKLENLSRGSNQTPVNHIHIDIPATQIFDLFGDTVMDKIKDYKITEDTSTTVVCIW